MRQKVIGKFSAVEFCDCVRARATSSRKGLRDTLREHTCGLQTLNLFRFKQDILAAQWDWKPRRLILEALWFVFVGG